MKRRSIFKSIAAAFIAPKVDSSLPSPQLIPFGGNKFDAAKWQGAVTWMNIPNTYSRQFSSAWEDKS